MSNIYDKSSLVLIPSGTKTGKVYSQVPTNGDGDFTFTRSSAATRVNADGNIEKETGNLLPNSNTFTSWIKSAIGVTLTSGQSGYDGSNDAYQIQKDASGFKFVRQGITSPTGVVTFSVYMKAGTLTTATIRLLSSPDARAKFNLSTGALISSSNVIDTSSEDVGSGWYRYSMTANMTTMIEQVIYPDDITTSNAGTIFVQDAQLEQGLVARDYIETTTSAVYGGITDNVPRLDYTDSSCPALLLEPQRTNLVPISEGVPEDFNNVTLTENYGTSPEGVQNSLKVQKLGDSNDRILPIDNYNAVLVSGRDYSISAFVKNIDVDITGVTTIACRVNGGSLFRQGYEWTSNGLITSSSFGGSGTKSNVLLEDYGNGWWRIGFTFEADGTQGNIEIDVDRDNGSDTTSIETWGWQLESATGDASYATSYIPTYGSSVTRGADDFDSALDTTNVLNTNEGTFYVETKEALFIDDTANHNFIGFTETSSGNYFRFRGQSGVLYAQAIGWTSTPFLSNDSSYRKYLFKWNASETKFYVNGTLLQTTTPTATFNPDEFRAGSFGTKVETTKILIFPEALSDADCITLTTI